MDWLSDWLIAFVESENNPAGLAVLAGSAAIEYIFPPFPGDTITLFGAVLISTYGWSFAGVFGAVMLGSVSGAMLAYYLGLRLRARQQSRASSELSSAASKRKPTAVQRLVARFERHGPVYLLLNRFFPGIRAVFFVAAGLSGMRAWPVLLYSAISAAVWNLGIIALGVTLGANFDTLRAWVQRYTLIVWIIIGTIAAILVVRALLRRRREKQSL